MVATLAALANHDANKAVALLDSGDAYRLGRNYVLVAIAQC